MKTSILNNTATGLKLVSSIVVPMSVGALVTATLRNVGPQIDGGKIHRAAFKLGEVALSGFLSVKAADYIEDQIDEVVDTIQSFTQRDTDNDPEDYQLGEVVLAERTLSPEEVGELVDDPHAGEMDMSILLTKNEEKNYER